MLGTIGLLPLATKVKVAVGIARGIVYLCNTTNDVSKFSHIGQDIGRWDWEETIGIFELDKYKILLDEVLLVLFCCSHSKLERP